jgi:hypothetical protein
MMTNNHPPIKKRDGETQKHRKTEKQKNRKTGG